MKKVLLLLSLLASLSFGCADDDNGDNDQAANGPEPAAEDNYYGDETRQPETTVVEVTTETTLPDTSGPR